MRCDDQPSSTTTSGSAIPPLTAALALLLAFAIAAPAAAAEAPAGPTELETRLATAEGAQRLALLAELVPQLKNSDPERGVALGRDGLALARELGDRRSEAELAVALGENLNILGRNQEALELYDQTLGVYRELGDRRGEAALHRRIGVSHYDVGELDLALESYLDSLRLCEQLGDPLETAKTSANIGNLYWASDRFEAARVYQERALAAFEEASETLGVAGTSMNLGAVYSTRGSQLEAAGQHAEALASLEQALSYHLRAQRLFEELDVPRGIASSLSNVAVLERRLGRLAEARAYAEQALAMRREIQDRMGVLNSLGILGELAIHFDRHDQAERYLEEAVELAREVEARPEQASALEGLSELAAHRGDHRLALDRFRRATALRQELAQEQSEERIAELELQYASESKAKEIAMLERDREIAALEIRRQKVLRNASLGGAALVLALLAVLFSRYRLRVRAARELERMARTDPLTGLPNRRALMERLAAEQARSRRSRRPFTVVLADVDDFKEVNDRLGHQAGDEVLVQVSERLRELVRDQDTAGRWGGEEFLLVLPETDLDGGAGLAGRIRDAFNAEPCRRRGEEIPVTLTFGISEHLPGLEVDASLQAADRALLSGKARGKNLVHLAPHPAGATTAAG